MYGTSAICYNEFEHCHRPLARACGYEICFCVYIVRVLIVHVHVHLTALPSGHPLSTLRFHERLHRLPRPPYVHGYVYGTCMILHMHVLRVRARIRV